MLELLTRHSDPSSLNAGRGSSLAVAAALQKRSGPHTHGHDGLRLAHAWTISRHNRPPGPIRGSLSPCVRIGQPQEFPEPCADDAAARTAEVRRRHAGAVTEEDVHTKKLATSIPETLVDEV
jgi:hypothetical protein